MKWPRHSTPRFRTFSIGNLCDLPGPLSLVDLGAMPLDRPTSFALSLPRPSGEFIVVGLVETTQGSDPRAVLWKAGAIQDLSPLIPFPMSRAVGINASGQIVGEMGDHVGDDRFSPSGHAFLLENGLLTDLHPLFGTTFSQANAINASGQIACTAGADDLNRHAFLSNPGDRAHPIDLGTFGGDVSTALDVNSSGMVTGGAGDAGQVLHPFVYNNGRMSLISGESGAASSINDAGHVVGNIGADVDAFFFDGHAIKSIGKLDGAAIIPYGINNKDLVVGTAFNGLDSAILYNGQSGTLCDMNTPDVVATGWRLQQAFAIDDDFTIVGVGTINGEVHGFLIVEIF
jgi:probable HAF family extracellular repeat protein